MASRPTTNEFSHGYALLIGVGECAYPKMNHLGKAAPEIARALCWTQSDGQTKIGSQAFARKRDMGWDVPLNEGFLAPVIEASGARGQGAVVKKNGAEYRMRRLGLGIWHWFSTTSQSLSAVKENDHP